MWIYDALNARNVYITICHVYFLLERSPFQVGLVQTPTVLYLYFVTQIFYKIFSLYFLKYNGIFS